MNLKSAVFAYYSIGWIMKTCIVLFLRLFNWPRQKPTALKRSRNSSFRKRNGAMIIMLMKKLDNRLRTLALLLELIEQKGHVDYCVYINSTIMMKKTYHEM
jgi:uncharacterized membrane protein